MRTSGILASSILFPVLLLTGCSLNTTAGPSAVTGAAIQGVAHGGQQAIIGAHVYLMQANTTGYPTSSTNASVSKLTTGDGSDSLGKYVLTGSYGQFSITGDYSCTTGAQYYLYVTGGDPGGTGTNANIGLMSLLGQCPTGAVTATTPNFLGTVPYIYINEVSTVAAAYAIAGFAYDATHISSSGTALAKTGIANAFATATNLVGVSTGVAYAAPPTDSQGVVPQAEINTLANILAACTNSKGLSSGTEGSNCATLFENATTDGVATGSTGGSTNPTETASAAINIAHNPAANVVALCGLQAGIAAPFQPALACNNSGSNFYPSDFTVGIFFPSAFGTDTFGSGGSAANVAVDGAGNVWATDAGSYFNNVAEVSSTGLPASGSPFAPSGAGFLGPSSIAIDTSGNAWVGNTGYNGGYAHTVTELTNTGANATGSPFTVGNLPYAIAFDTTGNAWVACNGSGTVYKLSSGGSNLSGSGGYADSGTLAPDAVAVDHSGHIWVGNANGTNTVSELNSTGTDVSLSGSPFYVPAYPIAMAIDAAGNVWVADYSFEEVSKLVSGVDAGPFTAGYTIGQPDGLAIDGAGNVWVTSLNAGSIVELSNSGAALSPTTYTPGSYGVTGYAVNYFGFGNTEPGAELAGVVSSGGLAADGSGNLWVAISGGTPYTGLLELVGLSTPVVTPIATGTVNNTLGTRP